MCEYPHVVVTGASSGTGRAVTLCLAACGYHVYAGVRTHAGGVALHQHTPPDAGLITPLLLDVTRPIQVMAAVRAVTAHTGPDGLAGLVDDAGTDGFGPRPAVSVTGELAVIRAFVPLLRRAQGRIVLIEPAWARLTPAVRGSADGDVRDPARRTRPVAHRRHAHRARGGRRSRHPGPDRTPAASNVAKPVVRLV
jgi:NAD(P)-dependent dehydrogenase (short-subunit alcohol dehydrogenase family)